MPESVRKLRVYLNANQRIRKIRIESMQNMAAYFAAKLGDALYKHITSDVSSVE